MIPGNVYAVLSTHEIPHIPWIVCVYWMGKSLAQSIAYIVCIISTQVLADLLLLEYNYSEDDRQVG